MSELNYASALAALDDDFASASAQTGSGNLPIGRYNAILKEAKIVARSNNGIALSVSFVVTEGQYRGRYAFTSYAGPPERIGKVAFPVPRPSVCDQCAAG